MWNEHIYQRAHCCIWSVNHNINKYTGTNKLHNAAMPRHRLLMNLNTEASLSPKYQNNQEMVNKPVYWHGRGDIEISAHECLNIKVSEPYPIVFRIWIWHEYVPGWVCFVVVFSLCFITAAPSCVQYLQQRKATVRLRIIMAVISNVMQWDAMRWSMRKFLTIASCGIMGSFVDISWLCHPSISI